MYIERENVQSNVDGFDGWSGVQQDGQCRSSSYLSLPSSRQTYSGTIITTVGNLVNEDLIINKLDTFSCFYKFGKKKYFFLAATFFKEIVNVHKTVQSYHFCVISEFLSNVFYKSEIHTLPLKHFCPLLKISLRNPYLKILHFAKLFLRMHP